MLPIVEFPEIVEHYAPAYEAVFSEQAFVQFKRYISGLLISDNKTIEGMNRLFVNEVRNQSSLNRFLTEGSFDLKELNRARLSMLASVRRLSMKTSTGVLSVDDSLLIHYGQHFEKIAKLWDHVDNRYVWAHNLASLHYSDAETDYPIGFGLWEPPDLEKLEQGLPAVGVQLRESKFALKTEQPKKWRQYLLGVWQRNQGKPGVSALHKSKLLIVRELIQEFVDEHPGLKIPVVFDSWYTQPAFCRFLDKVVKLPYIGTLNASHEVILKSGRETLGDFAKRLKHEHETALGKGGKPVFRPVKIRYKGKEEKYYSYCRTHRIAKFGKQRLLINFRQSDLSDSPVFYNGNRFRWQAKRMTSTRRHRWPVEVYYEEGKAEGLDQYQLRDFEGISRHIALVAVVYSMLRAAQHDTALRNSLQRQLKLGLEGSAPFWRRATHAQNLWHLALLIGTQLLEGQSLSDIMVPLLQTMCY